MSITIYYKEQKKYYFDQKKTSSDYVWFVPKGANNQEELWIKEELIVALNRTAEKELHKKLNALELKDRINKYFEVCSDISIMPLTKDTDTTNFKRYYASKAHEEPVLYRRVKKISKGSQVENDTEGTTPNGPEPVQESIRVSNENNEEEVLSTFSKSLDNTLIELQQYVERQKKILGILPNTIQRFLNLISRNHETPNEDTTETMIKSGELNDLLSYLNAYCDLYDHVYKGIYTNLTAEVRTHKEILSHHQTSDVLKKIKKCLDLIRLEFLPNFSSFSNETFTSAKEVFTAILSEDIYQPIIERVDPFLIKRIQVVKQRMEQII